MLKIFFLRLYSVFQTRKQRLLAETLGCLFIIALTSWLAQTSQLTRLETTCLDLFFRFRTPPAQAADVVYIEMDAKSSKVVGQYPWPRNYFAVLVHILTEWKAKLVLFDILFQRPSQDPVQDQALAEAFQKNGRVYLPVLAELENGKGFWSLPHPLFSNSSAGRGHVETLCDDDGVLRRIPPYLTYEQQSYPHLGLLSAYAFSNEPLPALEDLTVPTDSKGYLLINWGTSWNQTPNRYSYVDVLSSFKSLAEGLKPAIDPEIFRNKICVIGATSEGAADIKPTPVDPAYPGIGIVGTIISNALTHNYVRPWTQTQILAGLWILGVLAAFLFMNLRSIASLMACLGLMAGWVLTAFALFQFQGLWIDVVYSLVLIGSIYVYLTLCAKVFVEGERNQLFQLATRDGLTGLFTRRYFQTLLEEALQDTNAKRENLALIMMDIDHFKHINDTYGHQAGDMILRGVAQCIVNSVRHKRTQHEMDYVARYGGEEMIVLVQNSSLTDAAFIAAEQIRKNVQASVFLWEQKKIEVTISLGVSSFRTNDTPESLIRRADLALYRAKEEGRNRVCVEGASEPLPKSDV